MSKLHFQRVKTIDKMPNDIPVGTMILDLNIKESLSEEVYDMSTAVLKSICMFISYNSSLNDSSILRSASDSMVNKPSKLLHNA